MKTKHLAIGIVPARGGSVRIPGKNLVAIAGKPLLAYTILGAKKSKLLHDVYVSTEDLKIKNVAKKFGAVVIDRPGKLATSKATSLSAVQHAVAVLETKGLVFDTVVLLQATCPFRKTSTIDSGIKKLWDNWDKYEAVFSVKRSKFPPNWLLKTKSDILEFIFPNDFSNVRSQNLQQVYEIAGLLYVYKKTFLKKSKAYPFAKNKSGYIFSGKIESLDLDDIEDLKIARAIASKRT